MSRGNEKGRKSRKRKRGEAQKSDKGESRLGKEKERRENQGKRGETEQRGERKGDEEKGKE